MTLIEVGDELRTTPMAWVDMTPEMQQTINEAFVEPFTDETRAWIAEWWMACTQEQVDEMNAALAQDNCAVGAANHQGNLFLGCDLMSDAQEEGDTFHAAWPIIETLVLTNIPGGPKPAEPAPI
jgi:hypothetical protein